MSAAEVAVILVSLVAVGAGLALILGVRLVFRVRALERDVRRLNLEARQWRGVTLGPARKPAARLP